MGTATSPNTPAPARFLMTTLDLPEPARDEPLQRLVAQLVVSDRGDDELGRVGRRVAFAVDDDARGVRPRWRRLRRPRLRIVLATKEVVRARRGDRLQEVSERGEFPASPGRLSSSVPERTKSSFGWW